MAFSSFPAIYLDHPNLQQFQQEQQQHELGHRHGSGGVESSSQIQPPQPPSVSGMVVGGLPPLLGGSSIRPGSMVDRARQAKLPVPEAGLKCPRCDSSNTKFCYFNNYNLLQPRHFCKTCRRYWTRGGALRNVPVGGGCRRNKKSKSSSSSSKSTLNSDRQMGSAGGANSTSNTTPCPSNSTVPDMSMSMTSGFPHSVTHLPLMSALQNLNHYAVGPMGSNLGGFPPNMGFSLGRSFGHNNEDNDLSAATGGGVEPWRLPPIGGYEQLTNNLFPFQGEGIETTNNSEIGDQNVKSEESPAASLRKQFQINTDNGQYWNGNPWTGFSGHNSSSTSHLL